MSTKEIQFKISRYKPRVIDPPKFYFYKVDVNEHLSVIDALEKIRLEQEPTLVYRHACHHSSCGTCACIINGTERLACATKVEELDSEVVTLEPLRGFERIADLAV
ncbi:MAG: 2Fe-2S iron-sulfur cluster-binding protein, partial [Desulfobacterales bacterium]|nr:2Fe-2S iron-sulfur cluster-binding protein [Desulfobacterales bacterium]